MPAITSEISKPTTAPTRSLKPIKAAVVAAATATVSMLASAATVVGAAAAATTAATAGITITTTTIKDIPASYYHNYNSISTQQPDTLERRLQPDVFETDTGGGSRMGGVIHVEHTYSNSATTATNTKTTLANRLGNMLLNNFLPANNTNLDAYTDTHTGTSSSISRLNVSSSSHTHSHNSGSSSSSSSSSNSISDTTPTLTFPTFRPPSIENLVASSAEDLSNFRDVSFDIFDDNDDLFGSPLAFDASENGLWNGRFVPPPPRPPFFVDEPVLSDGLTTCDLCTWAMPTKSTFIFEGTIEKASELGWPLTLIIVSALSALLGAIIMVTVVRCRRKKPTNNRNGKCAKIADSNATSYHQHHQQLQYNQHLNHHYPHQHQNHNHHHHHHHNLNQNQYVHEHHQHLYPNAYRNLHVQYPLPSHHNATATSMQKLQQQPNKRLPQPLPLEQYVSNSCSSSSLTNDSQSTQRTTLSTIYRPPSYYSSATVFGSTGGGGGSALTKAAQRQKLLTQRIDMFTRSLPPPPVSLAPMKRGGAPAVSSSCISSSASSRSTSSCGSRRGDDVSICSEAYDTSSVAYEEPTTLELGATPSDEEEGGGVRIGDDNDATATPKVVEAVVMVAGRSGAENT